VKGASRRITFHGKEFLGTGGGGVTSQFVPAALILSRKTVPSNNVVVGTEPAQVSNSP
jgi:hypothetical protein